MMNFQCSNNFELCGMSCTVGVKTSGQLFYIVFNTRMKIHRLGRFHQRPLFIFLTIGCLIKYIIYTFYNRHYNSKFTLKCIFCLFCINIFLNKYYIYTTIKLFLHGTTYKLLLKYLKKL